jgi:ribosomal protein S18 acetylase RimI-like enzyme
MVREDLYLADKYGAYVAIANREVVGYATFTDALDQDGLQCLYWVHSSYQRRGIAKMLMERLIEEAFLMRNIDYLEIHVTEANYGSHQVAKYFKPFATSSYKASEEADKGYEDNGQYTVYYLVNPRAYAAYKAREILEGVSTPSMFSQRVHTAPGYSNIALARDLLNVMTTFRNEIEQILN